MRSRDAGAAAVRPWLRRIVPPVYFGVEGGRRSLARTFGGALLIRLALMPIAGHVDLLSTYHRSFLLSSELRTRWWVPQELVQAALLALCSPFLPLAELVGWTGPSTASNDFWLETFAPHPLAFLALFLFKLPYLFSDLAVALVLLRLFVGAPAKGLAAARMWLMNPVTIFTFYVFGRHDVIAILFIALGLLWLDRGQPLRGAFSLGVAIWSRYYAGLLLPFLAALYPGSRRKKSLLLAASLGPMALYNLATWFGHHGRGIASARMISRSRFSDYLLSFHLDMGSKQILFLFPMMYALLFLFALVAPQRERWIIRFSEYAACCLLVFYATAFFHPHYLSWSILFLVILRAAGKGSVLGHCHYLQILLFVPYTFYWGQPLFGWLFAPLDPEFFRLLPSPWAWIESFGDPTVLVNLVRSLMSAVCLFMVGWIVFGDRERVGGLAQTHAAGPAAGDGRVK